MAPRRPFGRSGLEVSPLCLGGNVFGWSADEEASHSVLDAYVAAGGNAIDSANVYSGWVPGNRGGESETIIGRWLAGRGDRDELVVATKVGMAGGVHPKGLTRDHVLRGAEGSLARLGVERIDLYYAHEDDPETPLAETLAAFGELIDQGLVGTIAASNYPAGRLAEAMEVSAREGLPRFEGLHEGYNLMDRGAYEGDLEELCRREGLGVGAYFALARGFLSGKYRPGAPAPESARAGTVARAYLNERGFRVLSAVDEVAAAHGASAAQVALAWVMARPGVTCAVASATSAEQVRELAGAMELAVAEDEVRRLDAASAV
ncbi:MAG TPA: aldo/keto reductase [Miltoncostaeaceae bacterium]|nr:aldo/keto reductase [Miltoncostaeaceae bacterium]